MSSGPDSGITNGLQISFEQFDSENKAKQNEQYVELLLSSQQKTDFFTGHNGKTLPEKYKKWIGRSLRKKYLVKAKNAKLKNAVNQLYRPGSFIGDGGTAAIIKFEKSTGLGLGKDGKNHLQKGKDMIRYLTRVAKSEKLSPGDEKLLRKLKNDLLKAVNWK